MTEGLLSLVVAYGPVAILGLTALSCLGVPIPGALVLLVTGAFVASGELGVAAVVVSGLAGAVAGDQIGYWLGAIGGDDIVRRLSQRESLAAGMRAARDFSTRWGTTSVFFSRWLIAPLGPPINLLAGALGTPWLTFTAAGVLGEAVWVSGYVALGYLFSQSVLAIGALLGDVAWLLAAGAIAAVLAFRILRVVANRNEGSAAAGSTSEGSRS